VGAVLSFERERELVFGRWRGRQRGSYWLKTGVADEQVHCHLGGHSRARGRRER
jgi:hypothetical protein